jgi:hypothetical protein
VGSPYEVSPTGGKPTVVQDVDADAQTAAAADVYLGSTAYLAVYQAVAYVVAQHDLGYTSTALKIMQAARLFFARSDEPEEATTSLLGILRWVNTTSFRFDFDDYPSSLLQLYCSVDLKIDPTSDLAMKMVDIVANISQKEFIVQMSSEGVVSSAIDDIKFHANLAAGETAETRMQMSRVAKGAPNALVPLLSMVMGAVRMMAALVTDRPLLFIGPPGTAKTTLVNIGSTLFTGQNATRIMCTSKTSLDVLFGTLIPERHISKDGSTIEVNFRKADGLITGVLKKKNGGFILFDEVNNLEPAVFQAILPLLMPNLKEITIPGTSQVIKNITVRVFGAINPISTGGNKRELPENIAALFNPVSLENINDKELVYLTTMFFGDNK